MENFTLIGSGLYIRSEDTSFWHHNRWNGKGRIISFGGHIKILDTIKNPEYPLVSKEYHLTLFVLTENFTGFMSVASHQVQDFIHT